MSSRMTSSISSRRGSIRSKGLAGRVTDQPYDPALQRQCLLYDGDLFEYPLDGGFSIFWRVRDRNLSITDVSGNDRLAAEVARSSKAAK